VTSAVAGESSGPMAPAPWGRPTRPARPGRPLDRVHVAGRPDQPRCQLTQPVAEHPPDHERVSRGARPFLGLVRTMPLYKQTLLYKEIRVGVPVQTKSVWPPQGRGVAFDPQPPGFSRQSPADRGPCILPKAVAPKPRVHFIFNYGGRRRGPIAPPVWARLPPQLDNCPSSRLRLCPFPPSAQPVPAHRSRDQTR